MTIPRKLFDRLTTSLTYYRTYPGPRTDAILEHDEAVCDWPFNANAEQLAEWQAICDHTRTDFERMVAALKQVAA